MEGDCGFLAANLYAKSVFEEDALVIKMPHFLSCLWRFLLQIQATCGGLTPPDVVMGCQ